GGVHRFTVGQRRGLAVGIGQPLYVIRLDAARRQVVVGGEAELLRNELCARDVRWTGGHPSDQPLRADVQIRYRHTPQPATVEPIGDDRARVKLDCPERAIAPGQAAVFYQGDQVLGGGWID